MRKIYFITFVTFSVLISISAFAQGEKSGRHFDKEAFLAKRNAFITAEVGLTPEEAAQFIPLCNEFRQKMFEVGHSCRKFQRKMHRMEKVTDADYTRAIDECLEVRLKEAQLEKEYYEKFKKILSPEKLYKYRDAEYKFARSFMKGEGHKKKK